ncbi:uncharacterized protein LOC143258165 [Tachypleus tridentatus]|uniref:uncharacterized protein LOC143258165 n=1 Tax=Tachypleus tridentatus TaxID=6853 RepID=UPI003FD29057
MKFAVFLLLVCCFLPALTTARNSGKNEVLRQETAAAGAGTNIINTITNLLSSLPSSLGVLLLLPLLPLLLILSGAGPLFSSLTNSGLGNLGALGAGAGGLSNLLAGTGATAAAAAANPGFYYREQRSANADGGSSFWEILTTVDNALKKYENRESNS